MNPCCEKEENLGDPQPLREGLVVRVCKVCGNRHFELTVDPLLLNLTVSET